MTLRCERTDRRGAPYGLPLWLALLVGVGVWLVPPVAAQDDGTQLPAPPKLKRHQQEAPDADFPSPLKKDTLQSDGNGQGGNGQGSNGQGSNGQGFNPGAGMGRFGMRRRPGAFNGGAEGGAGFGGPGGGAGFGGRRFGGQGAVGQFGGQEGGAGFAGPGRAGFGPGLGAPGAPGFVAGAGRGRLHMGVPGSRKPLDLTPLNLSENQKNNIRSIRKATREDIKAARQNLVQRQLQLRSLMFSADANDADIRAARKQLRSAQNRVDDLGLDDLLHIRGVLTAEQRQKLPSIAPPLPQAGALGPAGAPAISSQKN
jgi:Spy/CpxP family protein refolding chaperone